jgi:hypothetical protein
MADRDFDRTMKRWNVLRDQLRKAVAARAHADIVRICDEVLLFSAANRAISVVDWMFDKRASKALADAGLFREAIARIECAMAGCQRYRATARLARPEDFLRDIETMGKLRDRWRNKIGRSVPM